MPDPLILMVYILASGVGMAYFIYGKRQQNAAFLGAGVFLCIYPYFFSSIAALILIVWSCSGRRFSSPEGDEQGTVPREKSEHLNNPSFLVRPGSLTGLLRGATLAGRRGEEP